MKRLIKSLVATLVLLFAVTLTAETVMIQALSGDVFVKPAGKTSWVKAKIKDKIDGSTMIKVEQGAKVQLLSKTGSVVKVDQIRTVQISDLFSKNSSSDRLAELRVKLSKSGSRPTQNAAVAVAGVRGADIEQQDRELLKKELFWEE